MIRSTLLVLTGAWCTVLCAQDGNKIANFVRTALDGRSKEIIAAAVDMPSDRFGSRPSPQDMTFAQLTLHVADTNFLYCSKIGGVAEPVVPKIGDSEPKEKLVQRLKASFDFCSTAFARLADANKSETLEIGQTKTSRAMAILTLTGAWTDHVALQATYLNPGGQLPPTARN